MKTRVLVRAALIAALYVTVGLVFAPISVGPMQIRVSEALTLLPVLCPEAIVGVTVGCLIFNLIASMPIDVLVGTLATLAAALATRKLRNVRWKGLPVAASLPPVLINAVVVGIELTILYVSPAAPLRVYAMNMLTVGIGQVISCCILGLLLVWAIERTPALRKLFGVTPYGIKP